MLRPDRIQTLATTAEAALMTADLAAMVPPVLSPVIRTARLVGIDLPAMVRTWAVDSIRSLPRSAAADPERADAIAAWLGHVVAWLRGETDDPPPDLAL